MGDPGREVLREASGPPEGVPGLQGSPQAGGGGLRQQPEGSRTAGGGVREKSLQNIKVSQGGGETVNE